MKIENNLAVLPSHDTYCPTDYYPNNMVILSPQQGGSYSRQPSKSNCYFSVCTTHNGVQHKVYTEKM